MPTPTKTKIQLWIPSATEIFQSIMPPISVAYPPVYIADGRNWRKLRGELLVQTGCPIENFPEDSVMEYIHGAKGGAIMIRHNLLPDDNDEHFCWCLWHELGHFYAINSEKTDLHRYSTPGLVDDSRIVEMTDSGPVLGFSDERKRQEGYWFWQEFIAEAISKYVSFKHRSTTREYHPELIEWHPQYWNGIVQNLEYLLESTFLYYDNTIDEYALAHYFADLLMDDYYRLYVTAAAEGKLLRYDEHLRITKTEPGEIEPTGISDLDERYQKPMWRMKNLLEEHLGKPRFWEIDETLLTQFGECIGEMMLAKIMLLSDYREEE
ncbi:MAG: hypothetical protein IJ555_15385 [Ruminococcus sp.]|nr:hypothetical protein [Ruminococcus sp.]MBR1385169.1 hypothetical protein [Ruminococcus sp.]MBR1763965.1 hypothetical protein [Ruminococcus sp.]